MIPRIRSSNSLLTFGLYRRDKMQIPVDEQIGAILNGEIGSLATKYTSGDLEALDALWTVTAAEVLRAALSTGITTTWVHWQQEREDGIYILLDRGRWIVKVQERESLLWQRDYNSRDEALEAVVRLFLLPDPLRK